MPRQPSGGRVSKSVEMLWANSRTEPERFVLAPPAQARCHFAQMSQGKVHRSLDRAMHEEHFDGRRILRLSNLSGLNSEPGRWLNRPANNTAIVIKRSPSLAPGGGHRGARYDTQQGFFRTRIVHRTRNRDCSDFRRPDAKASRSARIGLRNGRRHRARTCGLSRNEGGSRSRCSIDRCL